MKKIAVICSEKARPFDLNEGAVTHVTTTINSYLSENFEVRTYYGGEASTNEASYIHIPICAQDRKKNWYNTLREPAYSYLRKIADEINIWQPDIIYIHNRPHYILWLKPLINYQAYWVLHEHNTQLSDSIPWLKAYRILKSCNLLVGVSKYVVNEIVSKRFKMLADKGLVARNGVDTSAFCPVSSVQEKQKLREQYKLPADKTIILYTGAIRPRKGVLHVVKAFLEVFTERQDICLVLAGGKVVSSQRDEWYYQKVMNLVKSNPTSICFLDYLKIDQMPGLYKTSDIYCAMPEWEEPLGLVFLEAQASGLPVITTRSGGIPEIVIDNETGFILDKPVDKAKTVKCLKQLIEDKNIRLEMGKKAKVFCEEISQWDNTLDALIKRLNGE
ncbi:MAG: glycosyltransferase family 4 protein [Bacteroidetes bacterium]|nr:glycosyltransferase family 4 protein [Bacteroidota bacterium]